MPAGDTNPRSGKRTIEIPFRWLVRRSDDEFDQVQRKEIEYIFSNGRIFYADRRRRGAYHPDAVDQPPDIVVELPNDNEAPYYEEADISVVVREGTFAVLNLKAIDPEGAPVTYRVSGGVDAEDFGVNPVTGRLFFIFAPFLATPHDANGDNVYWVEVTANDGVQDSEPLVVAVTVKDGDIVPPVITSAATFETNENTPFTTTATADKPVTWHVEGDGASLVTIDPATGEWTLSGVDFETYPTVTFELVATDANANVGRQTVTVTILDVFEPVSWDMTTITWDSTTTTFDHS